MESLDITGALRRRWYLLVAGLLATAALLTAAMSVGPTHEARTSVLLVPPPLSVVSYPNLEATANPFLRLDGLNPAVSILVTRVSAKQVSDRLLADEPGGEYTVAQDPTTQAPILIVTATGPDDAAALRIRDKVTSAMPGELDALQRDASVPEKARITMTDLVVDEHATASWKPLMRLLIVLGALGVVGTVLFVGGVDAIARSRKDARRRRLAAEQTDGAARRSPADAAERGRDAGGPASVGGNGQHPSSSPTAAPHVVTGRSDDDVPGRTRGKGRRLLRSRSG